MLLLEGGDDAELPIGAIVDAKLYLGEFMHYDILLSILLESLWWCDGIDDVRAILFAYTIIFAKAKSSTAST